MLNIIKKQMLSIIDNIDSGNSNITEEEGYMVIDSLRSLTDKTVRLSKASACRHLGISRATFDNYVSTGKLPKGKKDVGFNELSWSKKELDECVKRIKENNIHNTIKSKNAKL